MIYRLTLATVAAVFFGIAAQSANAMISGPVRPAAQAPDQALANPVSTAGGEAVPEGGDSAPVEPEESTTTEPVAQGISTSPGVTPGTDPDPADQPAAQQAEEGDEPASDAECAELNDQINASLAIASMLEAMVNAIPDPGIAGQVADWVENAEILTDMEYEGGCNDPDRETAE